MSMVDEDEDECLTSLVCCHCERAVGLVCLQKVLSQVNWICSISDLYVTYNILCRYTYVRDWGKKW
jgi:hypothetical protein